MAECYANGLASDDELAAAWEAAGAARDAARDTAEDAAGAVWAAQQVKFLEMVGGADE